MKRRVVSIRSSGLYVLLEPLWAFKTAIDKSSMLGGLIFLDPLMQKLVKRSTNLLNLLLSQDFDSDKQISRF